MRAIAERLVECGLTMHPEKSKIVYCQDSNRTERFLNVQFTFLGFTFRPRKAMSKQRRLFTSFLPGVSSDAVKRMRKVVRGWRIPHAGDFGRTGAAIQLGDTRVVGILRVILSNCNARALSIYRLQARAVGQTQVQ